MIPNNTLFFTIRFFIGLGILAILFTLAFFFPSIERAVFLFFGFFVFLVALEFILIYSKKKGVLAKRIIPERLSNGDENKVLIEVKNNYPFLVSVLIREEMPHQLALRDFTFTKQFAPKKQHEVSYAIEPKERGEYKFGDLNLFVSTRLGLISKKIIAPNQATTKVYPSFINLYKSDLLTIKTNKVDGVRKTRTLGQSLEFEHIKEYVIGDNIRHINWKATAKKSDLMINQFTDEKSKEVYTIIDTGRMMKFPFHGLSLLDYSINSALVILKTVLNNHDKAGMLSFNKNIENFLKAEQRPSHLQKILEKLYNIKPEYFETDFSRLYVHLNRLVNHRSLLFLFTNFENLDSLKRQLPYLRAINKSHVLVVIFFSNESLTKVARTPLKNTFDIYQKTIIEKQINEKQVIVKELNSHKIQTILTSPTHLTIDLLNKYLEIKAKGMI